jgi:hypothetical protein
VTLSQTNGEVTTQSTLSTDIDDGPTIMDQHALDKNTRQVELLP